MVDLYLEMMMKVISLIALATIATANSQFRRDPVTYGCNIDNAESGAQGRCDAVAYC